ncbi:MAG: type II secretion system protein GspC [Thermodesulfobacteriota bacterium]
MREHLTKYFWVFTLLFLASAAFLAARLSSVLLAKQLWVAETGGAPAAAPRAEPAGGERLGDYLVVQERNVFNANPKPARPEPPPAPPAGTAPQSAAAAPVARTPLNVTLFGTAVVDGGLSFALVQAANEIKLVRAGEEVEPGARLVEVRADRILVERGGGPEEVLLYPPEGAPGAPAAAPARGRGAAARTQAAAPPPPAAPAAETVRQVDENNWLIDSREIEQASANMSQLMTQIRVVPNFADGQPDGFKVFAIRPGSLFSKIGLQNGDVLKRINGIELVGPEQGFQAYQALKDETSIQIDLVRRNENKTFSYEIR